MSALALFAERQPFERYQSIIDRQPFGQPPIGFDPTRPPSESPKGQQQGSAAELTVDQQQLQKAVGFSVINVEPGGAVMVGFTDNTDPKSPRHYYMPVGETRDGWQVKAADAAKKTMTVVKDGVEVSLNLGDNSKASAPQNGKTKNGGGLLARRDANGSRTPGAAPQRTGLLNRPAAGGIGSFRSRRERREAEERQAAEQQAAKEAERKRQAEAEAAKQEEEKKAREQERAEQRQQLLAIQEELRKAREEKARQAEESESKENASDES